MKRSNSNIKIVTKDNFREALNDIKKASIIGFDTETSGLDPWAPGAYITSIGISTKYNDWCFPMNHYKSPIYQDFDAQHRWVNKLDKLIKNKKIVAQNGKFDHLFMRVLFGVKWYIYFDTMLANYNLDENTSNGLKETVVRLGWDDGYDISLEEKWGIKGSLTNHCHYLGKDIFYTLRLYYLFKKQLKKDIGTHTIFWEISMPISRVYCDAEYQGVYIHPHRHERAITFWEKQVKKAREELDKLYPSDQVWKDKNKVVQKGVNWGSPQQLAHILFEVEGIQPLDKTPKGVPSTSESVLLRLSQVYEIPKLILKYREAMKNLNTFLEPWARQKISNRIHPSYKIHGTVTGRPSCVNPNLQQVPRDARIRSLITAPPGWVLIDVDYSQAELRIAAIMSGDPVLLNAYKTGIDLHSKTVEDIIGIPIDKQTKEERKKGKAINFGFIYGMFWKKFIIYGRDNYGTSFTEDEAKAIRVNFFRLYSGLTQWHNTQKRFANQNGYVRSLLGRLRRLPDATRPMVSYYDPKKSEAERQAINSPVQSFASDLTLMSAIEIHKTFKRKHLSIVGSVHDSLLIECREDKVDEIAPKILAIMKRPKLLDKLNIVLPIELEGELEVGPWAKGKIWLPNQ